MRALFTLLITLCSFAGYSQKFMIGVQGGAMFNTAPLGSSEYFNSFESPPQMVMGGKLGLDTRKIQIGIGCQVGSIDFTREQEVLGLFNVPFTVNYQYAASMVNPYVYLNLKKNLVRSYLYVGVNAGITHFSGRDESYAGLLPWRSMNIEGNGITGGLHAGARVKLIDGLGISAEAAIRYTNSTPGMLYDNVFDNGEASTNGLFSFPLTLGIDYIF